MADDDLDFLFELKDEFWREFSELCNRYIRRARERNPALVGELWVVLFWVGLHQRSARRSSWPTAKEVLMHVPMPEGVHLSPELPEWVKLSIADAVVEFGRMEQEIIEISWILMDADLKQKLKLARTPATENFIAVLESVERSTGLQLDALKEDFRGLADERNLMVHGAWNMAYTKPWVVWHKFLEDDTSVIGEFFEKWRFERFMTKGQHILTMLRRFHDMLEEQTGKKTTAVPRSL